MRTSISLTIAATLLLAGPAAAQNTDNGLAATTETNDASATSGAGLGTTNDLDSEATITTAPTNGLTAGPGAAPETVEPGAVDLAYGEPAREEKDGRFPWGLLGLLGLLGLIPRKPR